MSAHASPSGSPSTAEMPRDATTHDGPDRLGDLGDKRVLGPVAAPDQSLAERELLDPRRRKRGSRHVIGDREIGKDAVGEPQAHELDVDDAVRYLVLTL